ncbi:rhomboid family intramembrane serine protease [Corynebacterium sp.]|uniref:rhomboid family intramembrane serine protease n=1 Tax=Corynebacterium sp. TaxID=1720 RepID=UPI0026DD6796|nr:rhomboid family intramembrane serine protease [Corynebacterium sp.]MDO5076222.1 rhomboid family intramembrane serine protease [Corynebacterium sp.]
MTTATHPLHHGTRRVFNAFALAIGYLVVIWAVFLFDFASGGALKYHGIHPLDLSGLTGIFTAPFLHADVNHLIGNSMPGAVFVFLIGLSGRRVFWEVTLISMVVAGLGTWVLGGFGTNHIGASGLIYGWFAYLVIRGVANRSFTQILLGVVLAGAYSYYIWGVIPGTPGISWQGHLFGGIGGAFAGWFITSDDPKPRPRALQHQVGA